MNQHEGDVRIILLIHIGLLYLMESNKKITSFRVNNQLLFMKFYRGHDKYSIIWNI